jgi:N-methylhydantoinase A
LNTQLLNDLYAEMKSEALNIVKQASSRVNVSEERHAYMRYVGQGHEIKIEVPIATYSELHRTVLEQAFEKAYSNLYGHLIQGVNVEVLSWALKISEPTTEQTQKPRPASDTSVKPFSEYSIYETETSRRVNVPVYLRKDMTSNTFISGPALITEDQTTTMVLSDYNATFNELGCILLTQKKLQGESVD